MTTRVSRWLYDKRAERKVSFGGLAEAIGASTPKHRSRVAREIAETERAERLDLGLLEKVVSALGDDWTRVELLLQRDRRDEELAHERWLSEKIDAELVIHPFGGFFFVKKLPITETPEQHFERARQFSLQSVLDVQLRESRRFTHLFVRGTYVGKIMADRLEPGTMSFYQSSPARFKMVGSNDEGNYSGESNDDLV